LRVKVSGIHCITDWRQHPAMLSGVLIMEQLISRTCRDRDSRQEINALDTLAEVLAASPDRLMDSLLQIPLDLCHAGTGGLSLLETNSLREPLCLAVLNQNLNRVVFRLNPQLRTTLPIETHAS
jgi:hypothetical protein